MGFIVSQLLGYLVLGQLFLRNLVEFLRWSWLFFFRWPFVEEGLESIGEIFIADPFLSSSPCVVSPHKPLTVLIFFSEVNLVKLFFLTGEGHGHIILIDDLVAIEIFLLSIFRELIDDLFGGLFIHQLICDIEFEVTDAIDVFIEFKGFLPFGFSYFL